MVQGIGVGVALLEVVELVEGLDFLEHTAPAVLVRGVNLVHIGADVEVADEHGEGLGVLLQGGERGTAAARVGEVRAIEALEAGEGGLGEDILGVPRHVRSGVVSGREVAAHIDLPLEIVARGPFLGESSSCWWPVVCPDEVLRVVAQAR